MNTPGIIGTAPAKATAENGRRIRRAATFAITPIARQANSVDHHHPQAIERHSGGHAAMPQRIDHPEDSPRRVVERAEPTGGDAGQRHVQRQRERHGLPLRRRQRRRAENEPAAEDDTERSGGEDADGEQQAADARLHVVVQHVIHAVDEMRARHEHQRRHDQAEAWRRRPAQTDRQAANHRANQPGGEGGREENDSPLRQLLTREQSQGGRHTGRDDRASVREQQPGDG